MKSRRGFFMPANSVNSVNSVNSANSDKTSGKSIDLCMVNGKGTTRRRRVMV